MHGTTLDTETPTRPRVGGAVPIQRDTLATRETTLDDLITADHAAVILGWHVQTVYRKSREGAIPGIHVGNSVLFNKHDLADYVARREQQHT